MFISNNGRYLTDGEREGEREKNKTHILTCEKADIYKS